MPALTGRARVGGAASAGSARVLLSVGVLACGLSVGLAPGGPLVAGAAVLIAALSGGWARDVRTGVLFALPGAVSLIAAWSGLVLPWPVLAGAVGLALVDPGPGRRRELWARARRMPEGASGWVTIVVCVLAAGALAAALAAHRFTGSPMQFDVPRPGAMLLAGVVMGLAAANAVGEELLWRAGLAAGLTRSGAGWPVVVVVTAVSFGFAHLHGIPAGPLGAAAAGMFGLMLGVVRHRYGFAAAVLVHFGADVGIFCVAAWTAVFLPSIA